MQHTTFIDATTPDYFGRETAILRSQNKIRRVDNSKAAVEFNDHSAVIHAVAVVMTLGALAYCAYTALSVTVSLVG